MAKTVDRSLDILFALSETESSIPVGQLASIVDIPISTLYRMLQLLEQRGLVRRCGGGSFGLGPAMIELGRAARHQMAYDLTSVSVPVMKMLSQQTGETIILTVPSAFGAVCVEVVDSPKPIRLSFEKGRVLPYHAGASAVMLLAYQNKDVIQHVLDAGEKNTYANGSIFNKDEFLQVLEESRQRGYIITRGEVDPGAVGISAPIFADSNQVVAALTVAGPADRFGQDRIPGLIENLIRSTQQIQDDLIGSVPA